MRKPNSKCASAQDLPANVVRFPLAGRSARASGIEADEHADYLFAQVCGGFDGGLCLRHLHQSINDRRVPAALLNFAQAHGIDATRALIDRASKEASERRIQEARHQHAQDIADARRFVKAMGVTA